ncbi:MAG TPA: shikimate dehydrogenase [Limnobacter sp.]|nr:shikimate dehydrogenase [Limnobacter sp.]
MITPTSSISRYVVLGNPIAHSMSPAIHADFAAQLEIPLQYRRLLAPLNGFEQTVKALQSAGVKGANVTIPFKLQAFSLADELSPAAEFAAAANTLSFLPDGRIKADNTDGGGLCRDLARQLHTLGLDLPLCQVVMIGAGGAASGCISAFQQAGIQHLTILNRTSAKAVELAQRAEAIELPAGGGSLDTPPSHFDLPAAPVILVNASSSSLKGEVPQFHPDWLERTVLVYDMMYSAGATPFIQAVEHAGLACSDGLGMLVFQAQLAFEGWTGQSPDALQTLVKVRQKLLAKE